jgi:tRNA (guanine37-N1)-methyltransferase
LPALTLVDALVRLIPGVLGNEESAGADSFAAGLLEGPQYTRPESFRGMKVPNVLLSGHHAEIEAWRKEQALARTLARRGDLLGTTKTAEREIIKEESA